MKVQKVKVKNCEGAPGDVCDITEGVVALGFVFDKCEACYKVFNSKKLQADPKLTENKNSLKNKKRLSENKLKKEKTPDHIFNVHWNIKDGYPAKGITPTEYTEFGTFVSGGGSTMGSKLAGIKHLGGVEIDPVVAEVYQKNHKPKYMFIEGVKEFKDRIKKDIKKFRKGREDLFNLDVFSGSPPCSSFSMSGNRGDDWGKEKVFSEGQAKQVLDTLFFDTIELAGILQSKIVIFENVEGILMGDAKEYVKKIYKDLDEVGYYTKHFVLNSRLMGVPQSRTRVFFISVRKDIAENFGEKQELFDFYPILDMKFNEPDISFRKATSDFWEQDRPKLTPTAEQYYHKVAEGDSFAKVHPQQQLFNWIKVAQNKPCPTIASTNVLCYYHPIKEGVLNENEVITCSSFPLDFDSMSKDIRWFCGMSVPPIMMAQIMLRIRKHILDKIK